MTLRPAIILDMDETLLHTRQGRRGEIILPSIPRPGLIPTLNTLSLIGDLYVLSAGTPNYIPEALRSIRLGSRFEGKAWSSMPIPFGRALNLGRDLELHSRRWVLVDDTPHGEPRTQRKLDICGSRDRRRFIWIHPFTGDKADSSLHALPSMVALSLAIQPPVRCRKTR